MACGAYGRNLQEWILKARDAGHEVLLQIPLEPENYPTSDPGPHTLLTTLPLEENVKRLQWLMSRYTGYVGVTNHMGAKFETTQASLAPVLEEVKARGLLYLDDGSVQGSTAGQIASSIGLDYFVANVQIDGDVAKGLAELEALAKQRVLRSASPVPSPPRSSSSPSGPRRSKPKASSSFRSAPRCARSAKFNDRASDNCAICHTGAVSA